MVTGVIEDHRHEKRSAASVATLFAPCQAFESAMGHRVSKQEAVQIGLLTPDEQPTPAATRLATGY
jgi:hypothetical protein